MLIIDGSMFISIRRDDSKYIFICLEIKQVQNTWKLLPQTYMRYIPEYIDYWWSNS